jgi:hypothetical protein
MFSLRFSLLVVAALAIAQLCGVAAIPVASDAQLSSNETGEVEAQGMAAAPHFVIYSDEWLGSTLTSVSAIKGYNVLWSSFSRAKFWLTNCLSG